MKSFVRHTIILFLALRAGDLVGMAAGMWFVPKYVSPEDIGAVLPVTSFATFLSLPVFALAMTVMKESACLYASGERGKVKSLLSGVFLAAGAMLVFALAATAVTMPVFLDRIRVNDGLAGFLVMAAAFLGCTAPVWTDSLQALKRFRELAVIEFSGSVVRFCVMAAVMPFRALAGFFAANASLPAFRITASAYALRRDLAVPAVPYWNRESSARIAAAFFMVLAYQSVPMAVSMLEHFFLRISLPSADSAGYYMATRFSDFLFYLTFPLLTVMFPYTAVAAQRGQSTGPYVRRCSSATLITAAIMTAAYAFYGVELLALMPNGENYAAYSRYMPFLTVITALTACQIFFTNAEVSAGRFGFMKWFVPLHCIYAFSLYAAHMMGVLNSMDDFTVAFSVISVLRFIFSAVGSQTADSRLRERSDVPAASTADGSEKFRNCG